MRVDLSARRQADRDRFKRQNGTPVVPARRQAPAHPAGADLARTMAARCTRVGHFSRRPSASATGGWDAHPTAEYVQLRQRTGQAGATPRPALASIGELAFSADGSRLAVGLMGKGGVRVWTAPFDGEPLADGPYVPEGQGAVYSPRLRRQNRLVGRRSRISTSRLYDDQLQLIAKVSRLGDERAERHRLQPGWQLDRGRPLYHARARSISSNGKSLDLLSPPIPRRRRTARSQRSPGRPTGPRSMPAGPSISKARSPIVAWGHQGRGTCRSCPAHSIRSSI